MTPTNLHELSVGTVFNYTDVPNALWVLYRRTEMRDTNNNLTSIIIQCLPFNFVELLCKKEQCEKLDSVELQELISIKEITIYEISCGRCPQVECNPYYTPYSFSVVPCLCVSRELPY